MIHKIEITTETDPAELRKLVRKKLMTGGAVVRLAETLSADELETITDRFSEDARPFNIAAAVLKEVSLHPNATPALIERLGALGLTPAHQPS